MRKIASQKTLDMLTQNEETRYLRQLILPDFGAAAQQRIKNSKVFVAGAGGLGGPASIYLAAAGVGHLVIVDRDRVELSNLNRQILHSTNDIDVPKADSALQTLSELNPDIIIETHHVSIDDSSISELAKDATIIVDCLDNIPTRMVLNRYSLSTNTPIVHAGIDCWTAQLTVLQPPFTPCINCLFEDVPEDGKPKPVLGAVAGVMGTMQALETLKFLSGNTTVLQNKLLFFDAQNMDWVKIDLHKNPHCPQCGQPT